MTVSLESAYKLLLRNCCFIALNRVRTGHGKPGKSWNLIVGP